MLRILQKGKLSPHNKELCVVCKKETDYDFSTPVEQRKYYVEGCGQLCEECYADLNKEDQNIGIGDK